MSDFIGHMLILDGESKPVSVWDDTVFEGTSVIYEVIRVEEGVPLFFDDYFDRLKNSFSLIKKPLSYSHNYLKWIINNLLEINGYQSAPVKLLFRYNEPMHFLAHLMDPHLPTATEYDHGVRTILLYKERLNPNAKVWNQQMRNQTIEELAKANAYEGILVNEEGFLTEGSRSNVFFIKDDIVYTTPNDLILPGITRKKVLQLCESNGIEVKMRKIHSSEILFYDAVFLTGTSRKVLPVKTIDAVKFSVDNEVMEKIIVEFENMVAKYIRYSKNNEA